MSTLTVYRTAPQQEKKAREELRRYRIRAYVPMERRPCGWRPMVPGYVFGGEKPFGAVYVRDIVGTVQSAQLSPLYKHARVRPASRPANPFKAGDKAIMAKGHAE